MDATRKKQGNEFEGTSSPSQPPDQREDAAGTAKSPPATSAPSARRSSSTSSVRVAESDAPAAEPYETNNHSMTRVAAGVAAEQHAPSPAKEDASRRPSGTPSGATSAATPGDDPEDSRQSRREQQRSSPAVSAERFKMVAARFRARMERRERRLEEAMSDPQTRTDLEAMFPGDGDYQTTLLAGVRGMEEDEFEQLLSTARKRRREQEEEAVPDNGRGGGRKVSKVEGAKASPSSPSGRHSPNAAPTGPPPPPAGWEGDSGQRDRYYPPPEQMRQAHQPQAYGDPYLYSGRTDPRGMVGVERRVDVPPVAAAGRGSVGHGNAGRPQHLPDDEVDDDIDVVFPHYSAPNGVGRRGGGGRSGGGGGGGHGGAPPPSWSRQQQHPHHQELHSIRNSAAAGVDGQVGAPSRPVAVSGPPVPAASMTEQGGRVERGEGRAGGRSRPVAASDYYDHPYYHREREQHGQVGTVMGGGGGGRGAGGRSHFADAAPTMGGPGNAVAAAVGHYPYSGPPRIAHDRADMPVGGSRGGPAAPPRSPLHMAVRGSPRGHPMGLSDRGEPLPPRYMRPAPPSINQTLCEAVERIFQRNEKHTGLGGAGGRVGSPTVAEGPTSSAGGRRSSGGTGGSMSSLALDAKKATRRIISIMESFEGRLNDVMNDARARAELDAIFPGMHESEFRALLEECIERSQTPPLYRQPVDRDYRDGGGERVYSRMETERMYQERERAYRRDHPGYAHEPPPLYREARDRGERFYGSPRHGYPHPDGAYHDPRDTSYPRHRSGAGTYPEQRLAARGSSASGLFHPKHDLPEDLDKAYDAEPEASYPKYSWRGHGRLGSADEAAAAAAAMAGPPPLYNGPARQGPAVGVSPSEGGAYHHNLHHQRGGGGGGGGGGGSHHSSPAASPPGHGRRAGDASPPLQALHHDMRSRGGRVTSLPHSAATHPGAPQTRARVVTQGDGGSGDGRRGFVDDGSSSTFRPDDSKLPSEERVGGHGQARAPRPPPGSLPEEDGVAKPFCEVVRDESGVTRLFIPETPPVVPRRPPSKGNKRETLGDIAHRIPVTVMRPYFNYPLRTAAEAMNISVTTLKRLCRRHGVKRWPHRQISGINRAMAHLEFQQDQAGRRNCDKSNSRHNQVSEQMQELLRRRKVMIEHAFESDDGGSKQQWKSSDSEDEGGGGDPESFSDTNLNHSLPKRRAIKDATAADGTNMDRRDGDPSADAVPPGYNPATAYAAIRAVRGGRGRVRPRSPDYPPSDEPDEEEAPPSRRAPAPMQSRRRLLPPTRPGRPTAPPPPLRQQLGGGESPQPHEINQREQHQAAKMEIEVQHQRVEDHHLVHEHEERQRQERQWRRERGEGRTEADNCDDDEDDEMDEDDGGDEEEDKPTEQGPSRRGSDSSSRPLPPKHEQLSHKRNQVSPSGRQPPAQRAGGVLLDPSPPSSERTRQEAPVETVASIEAEQEQNSPLSKPTSPLTCGPRLSPDSSSPGGPRGPRASRDRGGGGGGGGGRGGVSSSKAPSSTLPDLPVFSLGGGAQEGWGTPTAPTPSTAQEA